MRTGTRNYFGTLCFHDFLSPAPVTLMNSRYSLALLSRFVHLAKIAKYTVASTQKSRVLRYYCAVANHTAQFYTHIFVTNPPLPYPSISLPPLPSRLFSGAASRQGRGGEKRELGGLATTVMVWYYRVQRPTRHIIGHFGDGGKHCKLPSGNAFLYILSSKIEPGGNVFGYLS